MDDNNRSLFLAITLSVIVMAAWQLLVQGPEEARRRAFEQTQSQVQQGAPKAIAPTGAGAAQPLPQATPAAQPREAALSSTGPRVAIDTPSLAGSIALLGARIDDLTLKHFRVSTAPGADNVILFAPGGTSAAYYAEFGWVGTDAAVKLPGPQTVWQVSAGARLTPEMPLTLTWDNGGGLTFRRTIAIDGDYMFTVRDEVQNRGTGTIALNPYALVSRYGTPKTSGFFILHEGPLGYFGGAGLKELSYGGILKDVQQTFNGTGGWLGFTDKYWAATVIPPQGAPYAARFSGQTGGVQPSYQSDYLLGAVSIAPGATQGVEQRLFAGAKQVPLVDGYEEKLGIQRFELLIDWGWFHFITKPMFHLLDMFYKLVGNFGVAIMITTVLVKLLFFPLQNKSYETMSKMRLLQPEMTRLRERFKDDKMRQQQELMALYKKQKINPLAGCLPLLLQIPVFFALYKVIFVTIEMRHAPFFGWIRDLSAADPTNLFNLLGLLPFDPTTLPVIGSFLHLGVWPLLMGITMFVQMRLNPTPPDPVQKAVFTWMPVIFTFMLATFPAGLVIYWTWNNLLSIIQQAFIMKRQGVEVNLLDNIIPGRKPAGAKSG